MKKIAIGFLTIFLLQSIISKGQEGKIYTIDNLHSIVDFKARHVGFGSVRGNFEHYRGAIYYDPADITKTSAAMVFQVESINTKAGGRDGILKGEFFQVETYPIIVFLSKKVKKSKAGYQLIGDLTIRDVTKTVALDFEMVTDITEDQFKHQRIAFSGSIELNRKDYGLFYRSNEFWDAVVSENIIIEFEVGARVHNAIDTVFPFRDNSIGKMTVVAFEKYGIDAALAKAREVYEGKSEDHNLRISQMYRGCNYLAQKGHTKEALRLFDLTFDLYRYDADSEDLADILSGKAELERRSGDLNASTQSVKKALELDPNNPWALILDK